MSIIFLTSTSLGSVHCVIDIGFPTTTVTFNGPDYVKIEVEVKVEVEFEVEVKVKGGSMSYHKLPSKNNRNRTILSNT